MGSHAREEFSFQLERRRTIGGALLDSGKGKSDLSHRIEIALGFSHRRHVFAELGCQASPASPTDVLTKSLGHFHLSVRSPKPAPFSASCRKSAQNSLTEPCETFRDQGCSRADRRLGRFSDRPPGWAQRMRRY